MYKRQVTDVSALAGCASLHTLNLSFCDGVTNVSALAGCASLHTLDLSGCAGEIDVSALADKIGIVPVGTVTLQ